MSDMPTPAPDPPAPDRDEPGVDEDPRDQQESEGGLPETHPDHAAPPDHAA